MKHYESVLEKIIQKVYSTNDLEEGKKLMSGFISETKIKDTDKNKMLYEIENIPTITRLQFYATNAMFKFEGLGIPIRK